MPSQVLTCTNMDGSGKHTWPGDVPGPESPRVGIAGGEDLVITKKRGGSRKQPKPTKLADCTAEEENSKWRLTPSVMQAYTAMRGPGRNNEVRQKEDPLLQYVFRQELEKDGEPSLLDDIFRGMGPRVNDDPLRNEVFEFDKPSNLKHIKPYIGYNKNEIADQNSVRSNGWREATSSDFGMDNIDLASDAHYPEESRDFGSHSSYTEDDHASTVTASKTTKTRFSSKTAQESPTTTVLPTPSAHQTSFKSGERPGDSSADDYVKLEFESQYNFEMADSTSHQADHAPTDNPSCNFPVGSLGSGNDFAYKPDGPPSSDLDAMSGSGLSHENGMLPLGLSGMPISQSGIPASHFGNPGEQEFTMTYDTSRPKTSPAIGLSGLPMPAEIQLPPPGTDQSPARHTKALDGQTTKSKSVLHDFVEDGFISDDEGDPESGRISPCTFALWAGGVRRWDIDQPSKPISQEKSNGMGWERGSSIDQGLAKAAPLQQSGPPSDHGLYKERRPWFEPQYDEEDGEPLSPIYEVPRHPSLVRTPPGIHAEQIEPNEQTSRISRMDPALGLAMREALFGKPDVEEVEPIGSDEAYDSEELKGALESYSGPIYGGVPARDAALYLERQQLLMMQMEQTEVDYRRDNAALAHKLGTMMNQRQQAKECAEILALRRAKEEKAKRIRQQVGTHMRDLRWKLREQENRMDREVQENLELAAQVERAEAEIRAACRHAGVDTPERLFEEFSKLTPEEMLGNFGSP